MKQSALLRWIETAEARSVCLIAEEDPARAPIDPIPTSPQGFDLLLASQGRSMVAPIRSSE